MTANNDPLLPLHTHTYTYIQTFGGQTLFLNLEQTLKASLTGLQTAFRPIAAHRLIRMWVGRYFLRMIKCVCVSAPAVRSGCDADRSVM